MAGTEKIVVHKETPCVRCGDPHGAWIGLCLPCAEEMDRLSANHDFEAEFEKENPSDTPYEVLTSHLRGY